MQVHTAAHASKFPAAAFGLRAPTRSGPPAGTQMVLAKDEELFAEGDEADCFYQVVSGAIRSYKLLSDGRRQIDAFHCRATSSASKPAPSIASPPRPWAMPR